MQTKEHIFLEQIISQAVGFSQSIVWPYSDKHLRLASTKEELLKIFSLRSKIYKDLGYQKEFPDLIDRYNFDSYDTHSAIFYTCNNKVITGTCRIIFDTSMHLPIDSNYSLDGLRKEKKIAELSRFIISDEQKGLSPEFKLLIKGMYGVIASNSIDIAVSVIAQKHFRLYKKVGGFKQEVLFNTYGHLTNNYMITTWDTEQISPFFKKAFLEEKVA